MSFCVPGITHCEKHFENISFDKVCSKCEEERRKEMNKPETNADKYNLTEEQVKNLIKYGSEMLNEICKKLNKIDFSKCIEIWLNQPFKPTLTEDEKVILRNISEKYNKIARGELTKELFIRQTDDEIKVYWLKPFEHLFQFIQPRRRI